MGIVKPRGRCVAKLLLVLTLAGSQPTWTMAVEFRDFFGANNFAHDVNDYAAPLWSTSLSMGRRDFLWSLAEPSHGTYDDAYIQSYIAGLIATGQSRGVSFLPILDYNANWSWDPNGGTYYDSPDGLESGPYGHAATKYVMTPLGNNQFQSTTYKWRSFLGMGIWLEDSQSTLEGNIRFPLAANHVNDWTNFVRHTVNAMKPYGVEYYQVWNEAYPTSSFWYGGLDTYMQRVHLPAAQAIRDAGGKVVYGGWPAGLSGMNVTKYIQMLDANDAWASIDALDIHYYSLSDLQTLYDAAAARGYANIGIWQTEYGFTTAAGTIGNVNPRFLNWALNHGAAEDPNRYKMIWFGFESVPEFGTDRCLYTGTTLSNHGVSLSTLGEILGGENLRLLDGVVNSRNWTANLSETSDSIESFQVDGRDVIAIHTGETSGQVTLTIPGFADHDLDSLHVWRVDQAGYREDLAGWFSISGDSLVVPVNIADNLLSPVKTWDLGGSINTFYVVVTVPEPSQYVALCSGFFCVGLVGIFRRIARRKNRAGTI